jgi:hypothetical protein
MILIGSNSVSIRTSLIGQHPDKKEDKFSTYCILGNLEGSGAKSYMTNDLLIYGEHICAFPYILLGSPSAYMTLHPIPSEFPYIRGIFFYISAVPRLSIKKEPRALSCSLE